MGIKRIVINMHIPYMMLKITLCSNLPSFSNISNLTNIFTPHFLSQPNNNHNPNNKKTITVVVLLRQSNRWEPPTSTHHHPPPTGTQNYMIEQK